MGNTGSRQTAPSANISESSSRVGPSIIVAFDSTLAVHKVVFTSANFNHILPTSVLISGPAPPPASITSITELLSIQAVQKACGENQATFQERR